MFDIEATGGYPTFGGGCEKCIYLFGPQADGIGVSGIEHGDGNRAYVLDVKGTPVVIMQWGSSAKEFNDNVAEMDAILSTIEFTP